MLAEIFEKLEHWIDMENREARESAYGEIPKCSFQVVGQAALLEANLRLDFAATVDVDAFCEAKYEVIAQLSTLLQAEGLQFDELSNEIWMPRETQYVDIYRGDWVTAVRAEPEYIMISKALKAPEKNTLLLQQYVASAPAQLFFDLCDTYSVDLERIIGV